MFIGLSSEQEALRRELRAYYEKLLSPEVKDMLVREHGTGPGTKQIRMQMARDGWFCFGWPLEFFLEGGRSRTGKLLPPKLGVKLGPRAIGGSVD